MNQLSTPKLNNADSSNKANVSVKDNRTILTKAHTEGRQVNKSELGVYKTSSKKSVILVP